MHEAVDLCWRFADTGACEFGEKCVVALLRSLLYRALCRRCRYSHDIPEYLAAKPRDVHFPTSSELSDRAPFVTVPPEFGRCDGSVDPLARCPVYEETGACRHGLKCRFLGGHAKKNEDGTYTLLEDTYKKAATSTAVTEVNFMSGATLKLLRTKKVRQRGLFMFDMLNGADQYPLPITETYLKELQEKTEDKEEEAVQKSGVVIVEHNSEVVGVQEPEKEVPMPVLDALEPPVGTDPPPSATLGPVPEKLSSEAATSQVDTPDVPIRFQEKKRLNWSNKTCMHMSWPPWVLQLILLTDLAPLTTVGNLVRCLLSTMKYI
jgi:tRNA-dihydrouridine synthase 3